MHLGRSEPMAFDQDLYKRALDFAARVHGDQKVPGNGFPYVVHLAKVAMEVQAATEGLPAAARRLAIACALLHDTIEDSEPEARPGVREGIRAGFGPRVLAGVEALTKDDALPQDKRMADSLRRLRKQPAAVRLVKLADRITNLEPSPSHWSREKRERYLGEASVILAALKGSSRLLERRFRRKAKDYSRHLDPA